jgi:hypothetical protein
MADQLESLRRACDRDPASVEADAGRTKISSSFYWSVLSPEGWRGHIVQGAGLVLINDMVVGVIGAFAGETFSFTPRSSAPRSAPSRYLVIIRLVRGPSRWGGGWGGGWSRRCGSCW